MVVWSPLSYVRRCAIEMSNEFQFGRCAVWSPVAIPHWHNVRDRMALHRTDARRIFSWFMRFLFAAHMTHTHTHTSKWNVIGTFIIGRFTRRRRACVRARCVCHCHNHNSFFSWLILDTNLMDVCAVWTVEVLCLSLILSAWLNKIAINKRRKERENAIIRSLFQAYGTKWSDCIFVWMSVGD